MDAILSSCAITPAAVPYSPPYASSIVAQVSVLTVTKLLESGATSTVIVPVHVTETATVQVAAAVETVHVTTTATAFVTETRVYTSIAVQTVAAAEAPGGFTTITSTITATATEVLTSHLMFTSTETIQAAAFATPYEFITPAAFETPSTLVHLTPTPTPELLVNAAVETPLSGSFTPIRLATEVRAAVSPSGTPALLFQTRNAAVRVGGSVGGLVMGAVAVVLGML